MKKKWEYKLLYLEKETIRDTLVMLNSFGADGWELLQVTVDDRGVWYYFKREVA